MKLGRKIMSMLGIVALSVGLIGCGSGKDLSEDIVSLTSDTEVSTDGKYVVVVELKKCKSELAYVLTENGEIVASEEKVKDAIMKEYVSQDKKNGEYKYTLIVKDSDDNEIKKEISVEVKDSNKSSDEEKKSNDSNEGKKDEKQDSNEEESTSTSAVSGDTWDPDSKSYNAGDKITYKDKNYTCLQGHTSQEAWDPMSTPALWKEEKSK